MYDKGYLQQRLCMITTDYYGLHKGYLQQGLCMITTDYYGLQGLFTTRVMYDTGCASYGLCTMVTYDEGYACESGGVHLLQPRCKTDIH
jgi:hypothetical protein